MRILIQSINIQPPVYLGAVGLVVVMVVAVLASAALTAYTLMNQQQSNPDAMDASMVEDFQATIVKEGIVVPLIYGKVRLPGNLIWWGNFKTEAIITKQETGGKGGGGGSQDVISGYRIYLDAWQAIGRGRIELIKYFLNDKEETPEATITWSDGKTNIDPNVPHSSKLTGIAHCFLRDWYVGDNTRNMPIIHFIVNRILESPVLYQNLPNGSNPSAVVYDLLVEAGVSEDEIDINSFNVAAEYWSNVGYGINLIFKSHTKVRDAIEQVLRNVDGIFFKNSEGKYSLSAIDPSHTSVADLRDGINYKNSKFSFNRKSWEQTANFFIANYIDETEDFTQRTVATENPAAIKMANGQIIKQSINLKIFRDRETAIKRLTDIRNNVSYPAAQIQVEANMTMSLRSPGEILKVYNKYYGIDGADYRIHSINKANKDKNEVSIKLVQVVERLFDNHYVVPEGSSWNEPDFEPINLNYIRIFELPYTTAYGMDTTAFLVLAAREKLAETSFNVYTSTNALGDFQINGKYTIFSQRGTLDLNYSNTFNIDDTEGIIFTAYIDDPEFDTISRENLFITERVAIIGNEIMAFEKVESLGNKQFKLKGVIRGILNTARSSHNVGEEIWLAWLSNNIFTESNLENFFVKVVPQIGTKVLPLSLATTISVNKEYKAKKPLKPNMVIAKRTSSTRIEFQIFPRTPGISGAGSSALGVTDYPPPFEFKGDFILTWGTNEENFNTDQFVIDDVSVTGDINFEVKSRLNGFKSNSLNLDVLNSNGTYYSG